MCNLLWLVQPKAMENNTMYSLILDDDRIKRYVTGLDSSIRLICQQIAQAPSPGASLKQLLPELYKIDQEFDFMQAAVDKPIRQMPVVIEGENKQ